jgi:futalosine hydrolase
VKTLVVSAFEPEIAPLRRLAAGRSSRTLAMLPVGIGAVEAAVGAARAIAAARPARVIFAGTAGIYARTRPTVALGTVALASELILVSTAALRGDGYLPAPQVVRDESAAALCAELRGRRYPEVPMLPVACPLAITRTAALGNRIARATGAGLENLEAFAVARAARAAGLPFAAVLGVANEVGPAGHQQWRDNHLAASRAACRVIAQLLVA